MRTRSLRPSFDCLDARISLSDVSGGAVTMNQKPPAPVNSSGIYDSDLTFITSWNLPGFPPDNPYDPENLPIFDTVDPYATH